MDTYVVQGRQRLPLPCPLAMAMNDPSHKSARMLLYVTSVCCSLSSKPRLAKWVIRRRPRLAVFEQKVIENRRTSNGLTPPSHRVPAVSDTFNLFTRCGVTPPCCVYPQVDSFSSLWGEANEVVGPTSSKGRMVAHVVKSLVLDLFVNYRYCAATGRMVKSPVELKVRCTAVAIPHSKHDAFCVCYPGNGRS